MTTRRPTTARLLAGLAPFLLVGMALPLLAPSCGDYTPGYKTFGKGSLVIPMDVCYQCTRQATSLDASTSNCSATNWSSKPSGNVCPQALAQGDVIKAYGLVYQLIRNNVPVYWIIDRNKAAVDGYDLAIQYNADAPANKFDWVRGQATTTTPAGANHVIRYMGGPFVIDATDVPKAVAVMSDPLLQATFGTVNVHQANVAFQADVAKTMAGGWSGGADVTPKLALLDIGSGILSSTGTSVGTVKNSEPIIRGYLARAGLEASVVGAGGVAVAGQHGLIYDRLGWRDFIPSTPGDWRTSNFGRLAADPATGAPGYQILWVPHWSAPGSCTDYSSSTACYNSRLDKLDTDTNIQQILQTIGAFQASGNDVFAECAGLGSFEGHAGTFSGTTQPLPPAGYARDYAEGDPATRFQSTKGLDINAPLAAARYGGNFANPFLQVGDFPFAPASGAIQSYRSTTSASLAGAWRPETVKLISDNNDPTYQYFTYFPRTGARGSVVYLGGHAYSGYFDTLDSAGKLRLDNAGYQVAGSRLVLNTLFNLGAGCVDSNVECVVPGQFGECAKGRVKCQGGQSVCTQVIFAETEVCDGRDNDCNGAVDDIPPQACYSGPAGTEGRGICQGGTRTCQYDAASGTYGFSACVGQVLPAVEDCNGLDDDCDGVADDGIAPQPCYSGPAGTEGVGTCHGGTMACLAGQGRWDICLNEVTPAPNPCDTVEGGISQDTNCDGKITACGTCTVGDRQDCYTGPPSTLGKGLCAPGKQDCILVNGLGEWGAECKGQVVPVAEICNDGWDQGCHGDLTGEGTTIVPGTGAPAPGYGQPGTGHDGGAYCAACRFVPDPANPGQPDKTPGTGTQRIDGCWTGPAAATFPPGSPTSTCKKGVRYCQADFAYGPCEEQVLPGPELCNGLDDDCDGAPDSPTPPCGAGFACENGVCVASSCGPENPCRDGYVCMGGACKLSSCCKDPQCTSVTVCAPGYACTNGSGDQPCTSPCDDVRCGVGDVCAGGFCTGGGCYATGCPAGELCLQGACAADRCAGVACPAGTFCRAGDCVQACAFVTCGPAERCDADGFCVADPCAGKSCKPSEACVAGACVPDACIGRACGAGQVCRDGACVDDPCAGITCPTGVCRDGQCFAVHGVADVTGGTTTEKSGCGCGGGGGSPLALLGVLLALPLARRRRWGARGAGLVAAVGALLLGGAACQKETTTFDPTACASPVIACPSENRCVDPNTDPSHCGSCDRPCDAGLKCVDQVCGPAGAVAPRIASVSPASAWVGQPAATTLTLTGERFASGATLRATGPGGTVTVPTTFQAGQLIAQLDLKGAAPGTWTLRVVNPDRIISNAKPLGVAIPQPSVASVEPRPDAGPGATPPAVPAGSVVTLVLHGDGFMTGSACWVSGPGLLEQEVLTTLVPVDGGKPVLECQVDLSAVQPGVGFKVWVVNDAAHSTAADKKDFQVRSASALLASIAPSRMNLSAPAQVTAFGTGFDITSKVWLSGPAVSPSPQPMNTFLDSPTQLTVVAPKLAAGGVCGASACPVSGATTPRYWLEVCNGCDLTSRPPTGASGRIELILEASGRTVSGIQSPNPAVALQGTTQTITLAGANLGATSPVLEYLPAGQATWRPAANPASTATSVSGQVSLVDWPRGAAPTGTWGLRVRFDDTAPSTYSASFSLRVDSNQARLLSVPAPAVGQAGTSQPITLTATNLQAPLGEIWVLLYDPAVGPPDCTPTPAPAGCIRPSATPTTGANNVQAVLPLAGLDAKAYAVAVLNPNRAPPSEPVPFTVLPGVPTVASMACTSVAPAAGALCATATSARQQPTKVPIRITGTNFAQPDPAGQNGSIIAISSPAVGVTDYLLQPTDVQVLSSTELLVSLDTEQAALQWVNGAPVATAYTFQVWNRGGAQRSATFGTPFTVLP